MTEKQRSFYKELNDVIKEVSTDEIKIAAVPDKILNQGKWVDVIEVTIIHAPTGKHDKFLFRQTPLEFKNYLKKVMDTFINEIQREVITNLNAENSGKSL